MKRTNWYNYLVGGCLFILLFIILNFSFSTTINDIFFNKGILLNFIGVNSIFILLSLSFIIIIHLYHGTKLKHFITEKKQISFKRIFLGFIIWFLILFLTLVIGLKKSPEIYTSYSTFKELLPFLLLSICLTPFQTTIEELIFRSYIIRGLKTINKNALFLVLISSIFFALLHMKNPEIKGQYLLFFLTYFGMASLLGYLSVKYRGIEYSMGIHFANNFFAIIFLNYKDSPLTTSPLYYINKVSPKASLISFIVTATITIILITIMEKYNDKKHNI